MKTNKKKVTVFIEEELHHPARMRIADMDSSFQAVLTGLLREWVGGTRTIQAEPVKKETSYPEDLDRLLWILEHGSVEDREWIRGNLKNFAEAIESRSSRQHPKPSRKQAGK